MRALYRLLLVLLTRMRHAWYRLCLRFQTTALRGGLNVGKNVLLQVPLRCDGYGKVSIGDDTAFGSRPAPKAGNGEVLIQARAAEAVIQIGRNVLFSNNISLISTVGITIGDDCLVGDNLLVMDTDFHGIHPAERRTSPGTSRPVTVGKNVWFGSRVIVQKGVTIGDNSVIASQSVVTRDIPPNSVAGGNPAKVLRTLDGC
ncbi:acyltransferase, left-handed parallel beta-helix (hexapeptide repeat) family [Citrifermentans bemidjiense Bem]|uniref:Acyltransferase, left-handed parallel beta-helix (Hexapeptide repeat) family n=1 Tax=Citrifermentans bemidjiense (strain ATCC BAA-1014 / DSM 16622 / JCM 12645 / Bem) TaxID=404380 RepID=B5E8P4_CITBB|nr:acyltransferase [Citrifermentans bemidjiense]ACH38629.1 acyltransferase, left-handed parallel beta-helix (hexapeptide repeat) family [Citrifermentans bemidjiense Bem]